MLLPYLPWTCYNMNLFVLTPMRVLAPFGQVSTSLPCELILTRFSCPTRAMAVYDFKRKRLPRCRECFLVSVLPTIGL